MTPAQMRAARPLIADRGHVRTQRVVWRLMRFLLAPVSIACAAVAGAHSEHKLMREAPAEPLDCPLCSDGHITPRMESMQTEYRGKQGTVTLRYAECDACGSEITGGADGRANKRAVHDFRETIDCAPATGAAGLACALAPCEVVPTTARNQPAKSWDDTQ